MIPHRFRLAVILVFTIACSNSVVLAQQPAPLLSGAAPSAVSPDSSQTPSAPSSPAARRLSAFVHEPILVSRKSAAFGVMRVDEGMERILASHPGCRCLTILKLPSRAIKNLQTGQVDGLAIDVKENKIFTSGPAVTIGVLDRKSLVRIDTLVLGAAGGRMVYDSDDHQIYVAHDNSAYLWVIDARLHLLVGKIKLDGKPGGIAFDPTLHRVLVTIRGMDRIDIIEARTQVMISGWNTQPVDDPTGITIDSERHLAMVAGSNGKLDVFDTQSGQIVGAADIIAGVDEMTYDNATRQVFCASGAQGAVSVVQINSDGSAATLGQVTTHALASSFAVAVSKGAFDIWVGYPAADGSYLQCFSLAR